MISIRIMTYNVSNCTGSVERCKPSRIAEVIGQSAPDIIALQQVNVQAGDLQRLADELAMNPYGSSESEANALLSYYPLTAVRTHDLGDGGRCQRADLDHDGQRMHLFNVRLTTDPEIRRRQISLLLGPDLLGSNTLSCPVLVLGDFADYWWGAGNLNLNLGLQRIRRPFYRGTYPSVFPVFGRDRAYIGQDLKVLDAQVVYSLTSRKASSHLPLILTLQAMDTRIYLRNQNKMRTPGKMEVAHG
jgi:endonuclease/exonuclease/phosphatase family metal-dependent hydrolase